MIDYTRFTKFSHVSSNRLTVTHGFKAELNPYASQIVQDPSRRLAQTELRIDNDYADNGGSGPRVHT